MNALNDLKPKKKKANLDLQKRGKINAYTRSSQIDDDDFQFFYSLLFVRACVYVCQPI